MTDDPLSEVLDLLEVHGVVSSAFHARGAWSARGRIDHPVKFVAVARGTARLMTDSAGAPLVVAAGELAILNGRRWLELRGGAEEGPVREIDVTATAPQALEDDEDRHGSGDAVIGGHIDVGALGRELLCHALPQVGHVATAPASGRLRHLIDGLVTELTGGRPGSAHAVRLHGRLLVLEVVRTFAGQVRLPPGWLRVHADEQLRPALVVMHADPARPWRLDELARQASMSRTSFAVRFRRVAGIPPLAYLHRWRMQLARRALRDGEDGVGSVASSLGYLSEAAFSTAFKRDTGETPLRYRHRTRSGAEAAARVRSAPATSR